MASGTGRLTLSVHDDPIEVFNGTMREGLKEGHGTYRWLKTGSAYDGYYAAGLRSGPGTFTWGSSGNRYEGTFKEGKLHGDGTFTFASGMRKSGTWVEDAFVAGTIWDASGNLIGSVPNEPSNEMAGSTSDDTGSGWLGVLGAVAQLAGAAGGKNAAQLQALGSAMQRQAPSTAQVAAASVAARPAPSQAASARNASAQPAATTAAAVGTSGPTEEANVNQCVEFAGDSTFLYLVNRCAYKIAVQFCFTGAAVRSGNCARGELGLEWAPPNGRSTIAGPMIEGRAQYASHWYACKDGATPRVTATANGLSGRCVRG
ncbi:hypothetical protein AB870_25840 [Pandoraea faecigallinarum]|uniref:MORN repeat-containing protein n=1 Tax=Pandoraea faecigallinarum TaxID=656179 RepID=A0A173GZR7_9BURK|nr:hypothetical protein [Pandoraea faecigallinarum]ANI21678.1 hypothetical protein AB870_25840 [Pandoraea faecigallinarum]